MNKIFLALLLSLGAIAAPTVPNFSDGSKIAMQNTILAKVNGRTFSVMDVKKKMDLLFYKNYPHLADSLQARAQYYQVSWRPVLTELIDNELILADATAKELKLTDGEIREEMENRFGPNVMLTLDKIGLTYDETWELVKNEMMVQRMSWWFIHSKAMQSVTPKDIRGAYQEYLTQNPPYEECKYKVISIRMDTPDESIAENVYRFLSEQNKNPEELAAGLKQFEADGTKIQISTEYVAKDIELSESHRNALSSLAPGSYSKPSSQFSRAEKKTIYRIFYLSDKVEHPAPPFEAISQELQNKLVQKAAISYSESYIGKLRKYYGFDSESLKKTVPEDLHPFSLQ
ncbi:MAG: hypothetical protein A3E80_06545 [Chlamydiae bacterium RIFCSPHIGHO2_12_FULL_49_9]|nr:MAG: hypothetical protein A3E80_06545 [Chlamydiae bacterium RIFCSPHIGHO2_12_FULL_49_9]